MKLGHYSRWRMLGVLALIGILPHLVRAQQYTGMSGLIQVPSADMDSVGVARVGAHFINGQFLPDVFTAWNHRFHTASFYLSVTPFRWMEIGYTCTLLRSHKTKDGVEVGKPGLYRKDRYFSLKLQPIAEREGSWWPSVAVGMNDLYSGRKNQEPPINPETGRPVSVGNSFFSNYYVAVSKHFVWQRHCVGFHLAYRNWQRKLNAPLNGVVGGVTYQPSFQPSLRVIAEYTGKDVNVGLDWKPWNFLLLQASLQNGKYFSGGACFCIGLM